MKNKIILILINNFFKKIKKKTPADIIIKILMIWFTVPEI